MLFIQSPSRLKPVDSLESTFAQEPDRGSVGTGINSTTNLHAWTTREHSGAVPETLRASVEHALIMGAFSAHRSDHLQEAAKGARSTSSVGVERLNIASKDSYLGS